MARSNPLERAFKVLDIVAGAGRELSLVEIVHASGLPQSSTFRLASNLVESGMLRFNAGGKTYSVGSRASRLCLLIAGQQRLKEVLKPELEHIALSSRETAFFVSALDGGHRLLDYVVPEIGANTFIHPGFEFPIHATAAGKVIHAFSCSEGDYVLASHEFTAYQTNTITAPEELAQVFQKVRSNGYATNDSELDKDVFSICVPVLMGDQVAGALGIVGPRDRVIGAGMNVISLTVEMLKGSASSVSSLLV